MTRYVIELLRPGAGHSALQLGRGNKVAAIVFLLPTPLTQTLRRPRAHDAKKAKILTRESAASLLLFSNGYRRTAFRFHYEHPTFFIFKSRRAPRGSVRFFIIFPTGLFRFLCTRPANNATAATELTPNFSPFRANKNILIRHRPVN